MKEQWDSIIWCPFPRFASSGSLGSFLLSDRISIATLRSKCVAVLPVLLVVLVVLGVIQKKCFPALYFNGSGQIPSCPVLAYNLPYSGV